MQCTQCGSEMKQIPAGVSKKTGKPYDAFMACPNKCGRGGNTQTSTQKPNWDEIARGKVRHGIVCAMLQNGKSYEDIVTNLPRFEQLIMGKSAQPKEEIPIIEVDDTDNIPF